MRSLRTARGGPRQAFQWRLALIALFVPTVVSASIDVTGNWDGTLHVFGTDVPARVAFIQTGRTLAVSFQYSLPFTGEIDPETGAFSFVGTSDCENGVPFGTFSGSTDGATISATGTVSVPNRPEAYCFSASASLSLTRLPCGDGKLDPNEMCDDGDLLGADCCSFRCSIPVNGTSCDDGDPTTAESVCWNGTCTLPNLCGNGAIDPGEQCDDGNPTARDCCTYSCLLADDGTLCEEGSPEASLGVCTSGTCNLLDGIVETQVNRATYGPQTNPAVGCGTSGEFVVAWDDGVSVSNYAWFQIFDEASRPTGYPFADQIRPGGNPSPRVAMDHNGNAIATWWTPNDDGASVLAQRFDQAGNALGPRLEVSDPTVSAYFPDIAIANTDEFIIVWQQRPPPPLQPLRIVARRYDHSGQPVGSEIDVSSSTIPGNSPDAAYDGAGNFVITWRDASGGVMLRRFRGNGIPDGPSLFVADQVGAVVPNSRVGAGADGSFVIVWSAGDHVVARRYAADAQPIGSDIELPAREGDVAMDANGNFIVVGATGDGFGSGIIAQRFDSVGSPVGELLPVNGFTLHDQTSPSVCAAPGGDFVIAWKSDQQDSDLTGIFMRRFDLEDQAIPTPLPPLCTGDCDEDRVVTVSDLVAGVNIMLGQRGIDECYALDRDRDAQATIDELVAGVRASLNGC